MSSSITTRPSSPPPPPTTIEPEDELSPLGNGRFSSEAPTTKQSTSTSSLPSPPSPSLVSTVQQQATSEVLRGVDKDLRQVEDDDGDFVMNDLLGGANDEPTIGERSSWRELESSVMRDSTAREEASLVGSAEAQGGEEDDFQMNGLLGSDDEDAGDARQGQLSPKDSLLAKLPSSSSQPTPRPLPTSSDHNDDFDLLPGLFDDAETSSSRRAQPPPAAPPPKANSAAANLTGTLLREQGEGSRTISGASSRGIASLGDLLPPQQPSASTSTGPARTSATSHRPFAGSISTTTFSGRQHIIRRKPRRIEDLLPASRMPSDLNRNALGSICLLEEPIHRLKERIEKDAKEASSITAKALLDPKGKGKAVSTQGSDMWVDRYRPKKFADLLGDERVNRETIAWLKEWDQCVFKRRLPNGARKKRKFGAFGGTGGGDGKDGDEEVNTDPFGRPKEKVLLMSGPPGLGKTTLAQIVAAQAGYNVLEINASDDRTASTVTARIQNAIDAGTALGSKRPTLVVIDEVDGATGGDQSFIKSLLKLIQDAPVKRKGRNGKKEMKVLMRPIICICNDLYSSSLRPLRPFARVIRFNKPPTAVLVNRLKYVCETEDLRADSRSLNKLAEVTGCDIRSCLNTLQFIKSKSSTPLTEETVKLATVGLKDSGTSLQKVWETLFVPLTAKKSKAGLGVKEGKFVNRIVQTVGACGEFDRLLQGAFEHYPNLKWQDSNFKRANRVLEWVHFSDRIAMDVNTNQNWELMGYMSYAMVAWHTEFGNHANITKPAEFPKADYECFQRTTLNTEVATVLARSLPPSLKSLFNSNTLVSELAPLLMRILSPNLKPINSQVVKPGEKAILARLVEIMVLLKLRFFQEKGEDGQLSYRLEPPIDVFMHYEGQKAEGMGISRYAVRHLVAQEIESELARRHAAAFPEQQETHSIFKKPTIDDGEKAALDFFGRPIILKPLAEGEVAPQGPPLKKYKIVYKFHEGSSSAVRKPAKLSSLL